MRSLSARDLRHRSTIKRKTGTTLTPERVARATWTTMASDVPCRFMAASGDVRTSDIGSRKEIAGTIMYRAGVDVRQDDAITLDGRQYRASFVAEAGGDHIEVEIATFKE